MPDIRDERTISTLKRFTAEWLNQNMPAGTLVTVTNFRLSRDHEGATVFVSVLPETKEEEVRESFRKQGHDLHDYLGKNIRMGHIPFVNLDIDYGEKNRRQVEKIIEEEKD
jgi:ribosome-binding factor A